MQEKNISLVDLFLIFMKISSFTFGGGYTIIPVIKDEFSTKRKLIDDEEMMNIVAIGQSGPGAMAISTSILTGYRLRGFKGAIAATLGAVLPCIIIISIISFFYKEFSQNKYIQLALKGMSGAISAILLLTTYDLFKTAMKSNKVYGIIAMVASFVLAMFTDVSTSIIILVLALSGLIIFGLKKEEES